MGRPGHDPRFSQNFIFVFLGFCLSFIHVVAVTLGTANKINFFVSSSSFSFRTLSKIRHKTRMRARIGLKVGTLKALIKVDLRTYFGMNPINIHGVMTD